MGMSQSDADEWARKSFLKLRESLGLDIMVQRLVDMEMRLSYLEQVVKNQTQAPIPQWNCTVEDLVKALKAGGHIRIDKERR